MREPLPSLPPIPLVPLPEDRFRLAVEAASVAMIMVDSRGRIVLANPQAGHLLGYAPEELLELAAECVIPERLRSRQLLAPRPSGDQPGAQTGGAGREEYLLRRDGSEVLVEIGLTPIATGEGTFVLASIIDRTERQRTEQALRDGEARLAGIIGSALDAVISLDPDQRIVLFNEAAARMFGCDAEAARGEPVERFIPARLQAAYAARLHHFAETGVTTGPMGSTGLLYGLRVNGEEFPIEATISQVDVAGATLVTVIMRDATARHEADASWARLAALVQSTDDAIVGKTLAGVVTNWNPAAERLYGYTAAEMVGQPLTRLSPPELADELPAILARLAQGQQVERHETVRLTKDGQRLAVAVTISPIRDDAGAVVGAVAITHDVTARRLVDEQLRASQQQLEEAAAVAHLGHWSWDLGTTELTWSAEHYRIFGLAPRAGPIDVEEGLAQVHADDRRLLRGAVARAIRDGAPFDLELRVLRVDGSTTVIQSKGVRQLDGHGIPVRLWGTAQDITARKAAAATLEASEQRLRAIVRSLDDVVFEFDAEGTYLNVWTNDDALLAQPRELLLGRRVTDVLGEELGRPYLEAFQRVLRTDESEFIEYSLAVGAGSRWFQASIHPVHLPNGTSATVSMLARDITERKSLEAQLRQAQKMESVGLLAGGIAHDFNNLLTAIIGFSELALDELGDEAQRCYLREVLDAGERAAILTRQLLAFSRKQVLQPQVLDLNTIVASVESLLRRVIGEDIALVTGLAPDLQLVEADPSQVEQVIMNLAVNARDAMPAGGTLRIATANVVANPELVAGDGGVIAGPTVTLTITDTGHGMNAETQTRVFEPFFTTKEPGKGTGLGLSMVYGIVKQSGGEIHVRSVPGWGSTFTIAFPQVADRHVAPRLSEAQVTLPTGTETVLIVEDEPTVQLLVTAVLTALGYTVLAANGGEAALAIAQSHPGPVDLLVTDMVMPGMGGREVAMRLSVGRPELQVLFMSGFPGEAAIRQRTLEVGSAFIQKPFTPLALARKVRETLDD